MSNARDYIERTAPIFTPTGWPKWTGIEGTPTPEQIKGLQRELGVAVDDYPGPATIDACVREDYRRQVDAVREKGNGLIIIGARAHEVMVPTHTYLDDWELATTNSSQRRVKPHQVITHYDVTYSALSTHRVLKKRGYSTHFCIDGDERGTIWQYHDPATRYTWHGGVTDAGHRVNPGSIGVDLNNPADPKYLESDKKRRGRARQVEVATIHGTRYRRLSYFDEQITSFAKLLHLLTEAFGIPLDYPRDEDGPIHGVIEDAHLFNGVLGHYQLTTRKSDPAPLRWEEVMA
jgi:hypothetical protein